MESIEEADIEMGVTTLKQHCDNKANAFLKFFFVQSSFGILCIKGDFLLENWFVGFFDKKVVFVRGSFSHINLRERKKDR